jgi:hypothetical protein
VRNSDGRYTPGQVIGRETQALNSATVAFFDVAVDDPDEAAAIDLSDPFSVVFSTRDLLDDGVWRVVGNRPIAVPMKLFPWEHTRSSGWVGAKVIGSGILNQLLDAFRGLAPWDAYKDPAYLDGLLVSPAKKPTSRIVLSKQQLH